MKKILLLVGISLMPLIVGSAELPTSDAELPTSDAELSKSDLVFVFGWNDLHFAAASGDITTAKELLLTNPDLINVPGRLGDTPLARAVRKGQVVMVEFLLSNGAEVDIEDIYGVTPLSLAVSFCIVRMVNLMLPRCADVNKPSSKLGQTLLHCATSSVHYKNYFNGQKFALAIVDALLAKGADVNAALPSGYTPLHLVASDGNIVLLNKLLRDPRIDVRALNAKGETAEDLARRWGHNDCALILYAC